VSATEISETNTEGRIDIFPNPTTGTLTVRTEIQQAVGASIQLFDVNGRMVYQQAFPALNEFSIRLDGVPSGIYLLRVQQNSSVSNAKIMLY
jgi:hypothetical protein